MLSSTFVFGGRLTTFLDCTSEHSTSSGVLVVIRETNLLRYHCAQQYESGSLKINIFNKYKKKIKFLLSVLIQVCCQNATTAPAPTLSPSARLAFELTKSCYLDPSKYRFGKTFNFGDNFSHKFSLLTYLCSCFSIIAIA